jgi:molecular chaperone GrpE
MDPETMNDETTPSPEDELIAAEDAAEARAALAPEAEIEALRAEVASLRDQALRYAADAENTKRRAERDANNARAYAIEKFAKDLLGVADNLARALQHTPSDAQDPLVKNLAVGLEMTEKELIGAFERNGLKRLDPPRGAKFDPHLHQAVMEQAAADLGAGAVLQVLQTGYELFGRVLRPAMVVVSAKGSSGDAPAEVSAANPYAHPEGEPDGVGAAVDKTA